VYALHLRMGELDYAVEPKVECLNNDPNDVAFIQVTATIGGRDVVEEYVACKIYPLAASFNSESVPLGMTPVSKVETPLPLFSMGTIAVEHADRFLAEVETKAERVLGRFGPREYNALRVANIPNGGRLNHVLKQMGVPYFPCPRPGSAASQSNNNKRKADVAKKLVAKKANTGLGQTPLSSMMPPPPKVGREKKVGIMKISRPKAKPRMQGMSEIELALAKPIEVSKMFRLLDVAASSHFRTVGTAMTHTARVSTFYNLSYDSSPDVHEAPSQEKTMEKLLSLPPSMSGEFLRFSFAIFTVGPDNFFCRSYPACAHTRFPAGETRRRPGVLPSSCKFCFASAFLRYRACSNRLFISQALALSKKQREKRVTESAQVVKIAELEVWPGHKLTESLSLRRPAPTLNVKRIK
jgi:hypothetical protein